MLPAGARLRGTRDFTATIRRGPTSARAARTHLVVHVALTSGVDEGLAPGRSSEPPRVGLIVPRAVGPAVVRNRVKRRLRHQMLERLPTLPAGARIVVRALPSAATASSAALGQDFDGALDEAVRRARREASRR